MSRKPKPVTSMSDPLLTGAYRVQDEAVVERFTTLVNLLQDFASADLGTLRAVAPGFDVSRYGPLQRDAQQAAGDLSRTLSRCLAACWRTG